MRASGSVDVVGLPRLLVVVAFALAFAGCSPGGAGSSDADATGEGPDVGASDGTAALVERFEASWTTRFEALDSGNAALLASVSTEPALTWDRQYHIDYCGGVGGCDFDAPVRALSSVEVIARDPDRTRHLLRADAADGREFLALVDDRGDDLVFAQVIDLWMPVESQSRPSHLEPLSDAGLRIAEAWDAHETAIADRAALPPSSAMFAPGPAVDSLADRSASFMPNPAGVTSTSTSPGRADPASLEHSFSADVASGRLHCSLQVTSYEITRDDGGLVGADAIGDLAVMVDEPAAPSFSYRVEEQDCFVQVDSNTVHVVATFANRVDVRAGQ